MQSTQQSDIQQTLDRFNQVPLNPDWCFKNVRSTEQWTHGYHRYPAKFLPNLVAKLIEEYSKDEDIIADLFAGCGTTLVESKVHGRASIGVDINPVAALIARVKMRSIADKDIDLNLLNIQEQLKYFKPSDYQNIAKHQRIDYWFFPSEKFKIAYLYEVIHEIDNVGSREFFLVALSNILKNCSKWLQSSTKPQVDPFKEPADPFTAFTKQVKTMKKKNNEFNDHLLEKGYKNLQCEIRLEDARATSIEESSIGAIITSPPYVTSYEYADIHQLTGYWFDYIEDLYSFRKKFIGTFYSKNNKTTVCSPLGQQIINSLKEIDLRTAREVANYFNDMAAVAEEMFRILRKEGHACIVVGNTSLKGVKIYASEVIAELLEKKGLKVVQIIKRSIPYKLIPTIRDKETGRFTKPGKENSQRVYPEEYILIAKK